MDEELTRADVVRWNERLKWIAGVLANGGTALLGTALATWAIKGFNRGFDAYVFTWLVAAALCFLAGWHILGVLDDEALVE